MKSINLSGWGRALTLVALFLLPWQTRYIFWRPWVGTTESEFGVISLYATMLFAGGAALCFFANDIRVYVRGTWSRILWGVCAVALLIFLGGTWTLTYPTVVHAWILQVFFAVLLGYATHRTAVQSKKEPIIALGAGLLASGLLGIWQMLTGFSPESTLFGLAARDAQRAGDAVLSFANMRVLRMYGSFPHPNIFGAALVLVCAGAFSAYAKTMREVPRETFHKAMFWFAGATALVLFGISRSAALALVCAGLAWYGQAYAKKALVMCAVLLPVLFWTTQFIAPELLALRGNAPIEMQSVGERVAQVSDWWRVMGEGGMMGVGIYRYPEALASFDGASRPAWAYQPVHNLFLLIIAEIGVVWFVFWLILGGRLAWKKRESIARFVPLLACIWSLAWFDHVLWTSWAGMAYASVSFAIAMREKEI